MNKIHPDYPFTVTDKRILDKLRQYKLYDDPYELERHNIDNDFEGEDDDEERDDTPSTRTVTESTYLTDNTTPEGEGEGEGEGEDEFGVDHYGVNQFDQAGGKKRKSRRKGKKSRRKGKKSKKRVTKRRRFYGGQPALTPAKWTGRDTYYVEPTFKS